MRGACMICTGTYGSGAGTGMALIAVLTRPTLWVPLRGLPACGAAAVGAATLRACGRPFGTASRPRFVTAFWAFVLSAPEFCQKQDTNYREIRIDETGSSTILGFPTARDKVLQDSGGLYDNG